MACVRNNRGIPDSRRLNIVLALSLLVFLAGPASAGRTSTYQFLADKSTIVQSGGIAGIQRTYTVTGTFDLTVDVDTGTASFDRVDANAVDDGPDQLTLDPNEVFNLTGLAGVIVDDTTIQFEGKADNENSVLITLTFSEGTVTLKGGTTPPPNSADFFVFTLDAQAARTSQTETYVFDPALSTILQTGGIAGINRTYTITGKFGLTLDFEAGTATFDRIDANAIEDSPDPHTLDPNDIFNMTGLAGTITNGATRFEGTAADGSSIQITLTFTGDTVVLKGGTTPPPNSADFFVFSLDAVAQRKYAGGTGDPSSPYQIATAADLIALGETPEDYDKHFILTADIDLDPNLPGRKGFGGAVIAKFSGVFAGNNHTISHLTIKGGSHLGLFERLETGAEVRDVGMLNVNITGSGHAVGGLVGYNYDGTVARCYSTGAISGTSYVGGLIGDNGDVLTILTPGARVTDSYSDSTVDGSGCVGGLVGGNWGSITTSYSTGIVSGTTGDVGGLVGYNRGYGDITYCYASCSISVGQKSNRVGGLVGDNYGEITQCFANGSIVSEGDSTKLGGLVGNNFSPDYSISGCFWDVETSGLSESDGGTGLTTAQMQDPNILADAGWDFVHQSDGPSDIWAEPEGGGYPILWWQLPESQWPALPSFSGGTGGADNPYLISTPQELNSIGHNPRLMAAHFRLIEDIDLADVRFFIIGKEIFPFNGTFDGNGHTISNFSYTSTNRNHAGFFGYIDSPNAEVRNLGLIDPNVDSTTEWKVGSLVGQLERGTMAGCYVSGGSVSGGGYIRGMENTGTSIVGGLAGVSYGTITDCHTSCSVFGPKYVGGLLGAGEGIITNCSFSGEATGGDYVGGLVALGQGTITKCASSGDVSGNDIIGGLIGVNSGEVTYCYASSNVLSNGSEAGGLVGENGGTITDSYATGDTSGNNIVGGLVGSNGYIISGRGDSWMYSGHTSNCYSTGSVSGTSNVGGLLGRNLAGSVASSLWDKESSNQYEMCGIQDPQASGCDNIYGKTTAEMQTAGTFLEAGWDFVGETANGSEDTWSICEGTNYPRLTWQIPAGDFVCPDGITIEDVVFLIEHWLDSDCDSGNNWCDGTDLDYSGAVDVNDLEILLDNWPADSE